MFPYYPFPLESIIFLTNIFYSNSFAKVKYDVMKGNTTAADAILDRLVHTSVRFELKGSSWRQKSNQKCTESEKND